MPKIVDHQQRRREIASSVWRVLERDGLRGASVRAVVQESGLSSGAIRHYFDSQDELLRFAGQVIREQAPDRMGRILRSTRTPPERRAVRLLEELLPLDARRRTELRVFATLSELERTHPTDHEFLMAVHDGCRVLTRMAVLLLAGRPLDHPPTTTLEPRLEAHAGRLQLLIDGLSAQFLFYPGLHTASGLRRILAEITREVATDLGGPTG